MSLSLFIILLAFFIVMTSLSQFSEPKIDDALESLDLAFASQLVVNPARNSSIDERPEDQEKGQGDALQELDGTLRSVLPNLRISSTPNPSGGGTMAIRVQKDQFERVADILVPLFIRILTVKDGEGRYNMEITSYVRDALDENTLLSFQSLDGYAQTFMEKGLSAERLSILISKGNPAYLQFRFYQRGSE